MPRYSTDMVREAARGRWDDVLSRLAPEIQEALERPRRHHPCPVHGGKDGFRVYKDVRETGGAVCNTCGPFFDGFAVLAWLRGWGFRESLRAVAETLGLSPDQSVVVLPPARRVVRERPGDNRRRQKAAATIWKAALSLAHPDATIGRCYLAARGIDARKVLPIIGGWALRFHPRLPYYDENGVCEGRFPALVAAVTGQDGYGITVHRLYLSIDGSEKAPVLTPKKLMPAGCPLTGSAIRLGPAAPVLHVAEGLETALSIIQETQEPVWSCISGALLAAFVPPPGTRRLHIWADKDVARNPQDGLPVGEHYARQLATRMAHEDIPAEIILPRYQIPEGRKGLDWNDVLAHKGPEGFTMRRAYVA